MDFEMYFRYALELAIVLPASVFALLPVRHYLRWHPMVICLISLLADFTFILIGAYLCIRFRIPADLFLLLLFPPFYILYHIFVQLSPDRKSFCFFNAVMLVIFCFVYTIFLTAPMEKDNTSGVFLPISGIITLLLPVLVCLFSMHAFLIEFPELFKIEIMNPVWKYLTFLPVITIAIFLWVTPNNTSIIMTGRVRSISLVLMLLFPLSMFFFYHLLWRITKSLQENTQLRLENDLFAMEYKRYRQVQEYNKLTREFRHNIRQHLIVISNLANNGEVEKLKEYINQFDEFVTPPEKYAENLAVDSIAGKYTALAAEQQTEISWNLDLPADLPVSEADFCSILGNLTENAVQAVAGLPVGKRKITVSARMLSEHMLGLTVKNPCSNQIVIGKNGLPRTRKKGGHGIGLVSVSTIAGKYNGTLDIKVENEVFTASVLLYC